ncbi:unnamed protein product, partial [Polarella glacialis]
MQGFTKKPRRELPKVFAESRLLQEEPTAEQRAEAEEPPEKKVKATRTNKFKKDGRETKSWAEKVDGAKVRNVHFNASENEQIMQGVRAFAVEKGVEEKEL